MATVLNDIQSQLVLYYDSIVLLIPKFLVASIIFFIVWLIANKTRKKVVNQLKDRSSDPLLAIFIGRIYNIVLIIFGVILFLKIIDLGGIATGLMGTAGVGAFILGFAFKDIGEHFLAGFILAFNRPFQVGDLVELDGQKGKVVTLNIRDTQLKTFDGRDLFIPNGNIIKNALVNYTIDGFIRHEVTIGIDYGNDLIKALEIIMDIMASIPGILQEDKKPSVAINSLGSSSLNVNVYYWLDTFDKSINGVEIKINIVNQLLTKLGSEGFYLPGDIIELKNYNNEQLKLSEV